ncbi:MAG: type II toxin-antitoxin system PemK/MazF family toxin [Rhodopseudomonas sp.]|uniref:type II toxin-antitoxin system PemK/MazF family toxin n=1 Tax=Rhodopseudomonas sp. TaxID=1078 RepID=UPI0017EAC115|nr:type II toxin-antitoxin system PemK/MazF family toxin [Rhodopseudomonas sp.]NVN88249.1 type II toxin-antitoxin system PemK/MazF family toxin [Rhodopseudomonas sp.]
MKQGDIIAVALPGDYGKPRPAVVIQSDAFQHLNSVTILPLTGHVLSLERCRVVIGPSEENGLREISQVMVEKASTVPRHKAGQLIGHLSSDDMTAVNRALAIFLGFV